MCTHYVRPFFLAARASARGGHWFTPGTQKSPDLTSEDSILVRDTGIEPARGRIFRAREAPINLSLAEGISPRRSLVRPPGTQKIPGLTIRGFLNICARYWVRTSEGKNFPSARGTNKSFPRRGRQPEEVTGSSLGTQKIPGPSIRGFLIICARYWVRTSDLFGVNEARYHCANRAHR